MVLARRFEETVNDLYMQGRIPSTLHLAIGQEASAVGVLSGLKAGDTVFSTHRPHAHAIAHGVSPDAMMAELMAKATGTCKGKGGSMHIGDFRLGFVPAIAIVGGNIPIAAGAALAAKLKGSDAVTVCFFGDGAANEGAWHEGLNLAAIWDLPVVFVCENNQYAASTPFREAFRIPAIADRAAAYGMPGVTVDGNDVLAVYAAAGAAIARARRGAGPTLLELLTYRLCGHSRSDPRTYRTREEEAEWQQRDPIPAFAANLVSHRFATEEQLAEIDAEVETILVQAIAYAEQSPGPALADVVYGLYA
ncbi:MAG: thiamine pyrophosphate-dependent dehydrogenase E1 component subunit alpha [Anaerolineales bacterium]|nr:thiamine pyrophosphate-dependent dehydrogenase E1 component subunit alpha [Anaerolineales bacterium]